MNDAVDRSKANDINDTLRQVAKIAGLDDAGVAALKSIAKLESFPAGTIMFNEGETHDRIYFIVTGAVSIEMLTSKCGRQTILSVGSSDLLAWTSLIGDRVMTATAVANSDVQVVAFQTDELKILLDANHDVGYQVMRLLAKSLSRRLLATRLQLLDLYGS